MAARGVDGHVNRLHGQMIYKSSREVKEKERMSSGPEQFSHSIWSLKKVFDFKKLSGLLPLDAIVEGTQKRKICAALNI